MTTVTRRNVSERYRARGGMAGILALAARPHLHRARRYTGCVG